MRRTEITSRGRSGDVLHLLTAVASRKREGSSPTGVVGRSLARQLIAAGGRVRVLAEPEQCDDWPFGTEVVAGSITSLHGYADAVAGADTMFLAGPHPETVGEALRLADRSQLGRLVLLSSHGPEYEEAYPSDTWFWLAMEKAVQQSAIPATIIRPSAVMGAMLEDSYPATGSGWPQMIRTTGVVSEPFAAEGHYPFIHEDDLAAVAAAALQNEAHTGKVLEAVGLPSSTRSRVASVAAALSRSIDLIELTPEDARVHWRERGWPDGAVDVTLYALQEYGTRLAELTEWTLAQRPTVTELIGRPPRTFDDWVTEHIHLFR